MADDVSRLTPREREVLSLMAAGKTNAEISEALGVSFTTIKTHVSSVLTKLDASDRKDAVERWKAGSGRKWGLVFIPAALLGGVAVLAVLAFAAHAWTADNSEQPRTLRYPLANLILDVPTHLPLSGFGESPFGQAYGVWLVRHPDDTVSAFFDRDPHTGCVVPWRPDYVWQPANIQEVVGAFKEGCGGWVYLRTGEAVFGAPPRGLDGFPVTIDANTVVVDLTRVRLGQCRSDSAPPSCSTRDNPQYVAHPPPPNIPDWGSRVTP